MVMVILKFAELLMVILKFVFTSVAALLYRYFLFRHLNDLTLGTRENQEKNYFLGVFNEYLKLLFEVLHCFVNATLCKVLVYKVTEETRKICRPQDKAQVKTMMRCAIWYNLYNLKKREKHSWRSVTFSKVATKSNTPPRVVFTFLKLYKW